MLKAMIFDLDGTIGNTLPLCVAAFRQAVEPLTGKVLTDRDIYATFGPSEEGTIMQLVPDHYQRGVEEYIRHYERLHFMCPEPFPGIMDILTWLKSKGVILALVTGKGARSCRITLERYGMAGIFDMVETGSPEGQRKKEGMEAVLQRFALQPGEAIYVGDAPSDITACHAVGIPIVAAAWAPTANPGELLPLRPHRLFTTVAQFRVYLESTI